MIGRKIVTAVLCLAGGVALLAPAPAVASAVATRTYTLGSGGTAFRVASGNGVGGLAGGGLGAAVGELASIGAASPGYEQLGVAQPDPVSVQALDGGDVLVADAANRLVAEFSSGGALVWSYRIADAASAPVSARSLSGQSVTASGGVLGGLVLICDQGGDRAFIIDANAGDQVVWQYGTTDAAGSDVDHLDAPASAEWLPVSGASGSDFTRYGNVAVCDAGNHRVIVVRTADFTGAGSGGGFSAQSIVWQYGSAGASGSGVDQLEQPVSVQRLDAAAGTTHGDMLICDRQAARVIEVRSADYDAAASYDGFTAASVVWQFSSSGDVTLQAPTCALGGFDGDSVIWIVDAGQQYPRLLGVATGAYTTSGGGHVGPAAHRVFADDVTGSALSTGFTALLSAPAWLSQVAASDPDHPGALVVADPGERRVVTLGTGASVGVRLAAVDLGRSGRKQVLSVRCVLGPVPTSAVSVSYSIDGGSLRSLGSFRVEPGTVSGSVTTTPIAFPPLTVGRNIAYSVTFAAGGAAFAPALLSLTTAFRPWTAKASGSGGGGASGDRKDSNGDASGNDSSAGGGAGSGGGVGGGTGSGSGQGAGSGRGSGSTDANGAQTGGTAGGAAPPAAVAASGAAGSTQTISGYVFRAAGRAGGGEGGGSASQGLGSAFLPASLGAAGVVMLLLAGPWRERRRLRLFAGWGDDLPRPFPAEQTRELPPRRASVITNPRFARLLGRQASLPQR